MSAKKKSIEGGEVSPLAPEVLRVSDLTSRVPPERTAEATDTPLEGLPEGWIIQNLSNLVDIITGKLDSNAAVDNGKYSFFTCAPEPLKIDNFAFDCDAILLAGNNANGIFHLNRFCGKFNAYQRTYVITCKKDTVHLDFLFYILKTKLQHFSDMSQGSATKFLTIKILNALQVVLPPFPQQKKIASILSSLDDKIELNRAMNETLESIAQALFKSWFVDFDPVRARVAGKKPVGMDDATAALFPDSFVDSELGPIPKGWEVKSLDTLGHFLNGLAMQNFPPVDGLETVPVIKIAELKKGDTENADIASANIDPNYIVEDGDLLFSWSGSLFVDVWCGGRGALNQHLYKVTSELYPKWFLLVWINAHLASFQKIAADKAVTMGHIKRSHLTEAKCIVPDSDFITRACGQFETMLEKYERNKLENRNLVAIRDSLLPKLLSGEISVASIGDDAK